MQQKATPGGSSTPASGGRGTATGANALADRSVTRDKARGETDARLAAESHTAAINRIEETVRLENIDCDFAGNAAFYREQHAL